MLSVSALICGFFTNDMTSISAASMESCTKAVELVLYLSGSMCLWGGLMKICERSGITAAIARMLSPVTKLLFKEAVHCPAVMNAVTMNLTANLLGLGNAATPSGIAAVKAMQQLPKLQGCEAHSTVILSQVDEKVFRKLGVHITYEPHYQESKLYHV